MTDTQTAVHELLLMKEPEFRELVDKSVRKQTTPEEEAALQEPLVVDRWYAALSRMMRSVESQLACRREEFNIAKAKYKIDLSKCSSKAEREKIYEEFLAFSHEYSTQRSKRLKFKIGLEDHLLRAYWIRVSYAGETGQVSDSKLLTRVQELENGILRHKTTTLGEVDPTDYDEELWRLAERGRNSRN